MSASLPKHISVVELAERLNQEVSSLADSDLTWWREHGVAPFPVIHGDQSHFVVAVAGQDILFFADDEDEFGVARLVTGSDRMTGYGLFGDLQNAIRGIRQIAA